VSYFSLRAPPHSEDTTAPMARIARIVTMAAALLFAFVATAPVVRVTHTRTNIQLHNLFFRPAPLRQRPSPTN